MTRIESVRAATDSAKSGMLHAADVVAPYAGTAKVRAGQYAQETRVRLAPKLSQAAEQTLAQYGTHVQPHMERARAQVSPKVELAAHQAAIQTRKAARRAADSRQRLEQARAAAGPAKEEAAARGAAALAALRGQVPARQIQRLVRKQRRRAKAGRAAKTLFVLGAVAGGACAAWKWWDSQANPDWLVEPPSADELQEAGTPTSVDDGLGSPPDPEVRAEGPGRHEEEKEDTSGRGEQTR